MINVFPDGVVMYGAGDQGRVNWPILKRLGARVVALVDDTPELVNPFPEAPLLHGMDHLKSWLLGQRPPRLGFIVAIGNPYGDARLAIHDGLTALDLTPVSFADPSAVISGDAEIGPGAQIMPGAVIQTKARLGRQVIVNTRASVDHDCVLHDGVEIAPGAVLCGRVEVGRNSWVCAGATVVSRVRIGANALVGAGAAVTSDVRDGTMVVGIPAAEKSGRVLRLMEQRRA